MIRNSKVIVGEWKGIKGICPDCMYILRCAFPRHSILNKYIVVKCNQYIMGLEDTDYDIIFLEDAVVYVK